MKSIHYIAFIILIVGGLNWLALGLFQWEIGELFGGSANIISRVIYIIIGIAAAYELIAHKTRCKSCSVGGSSGNTTV